MSAYEMDKEAMKSGLEAVLGLIDTDLLRGVAVIALYKDGRVFEGGDCDDLFCMSRKLKEFAKCIESSALASEEPELCGVTVPVYGGKGELN